MFLGYALFSRTSQSYFQNTWVANKTETDNFFEAVWQVVRLIPKGRVSSYGAIARYLGSAKSSRMVGWAMNASHGVLPIVPAQRVVNRNGMLSGKAHFASRSLMQELLEKEGLKVEENCIVNFEKYFWDPNTELKL